MFLFFLAKWTVFRMLWLPDIKLLLEGLWTIVCDYLIDKCCDNHKKKDYKDCDYLTNKGLAERRSVWQPWRPQVADCCSPALWSYIYKKDFPFSGKKTWQNLKDFPFSEKKHIVFDDFPFSGKSMTKIEWFSFFLEKAWNNVEDFPFSGKSMTKFGWFSSFWKKSDTIMRIFLFLEKNMT